MDFVYFESPQKIHLIPIKPNKSEDLNIKNIDIDNQIILQFSSLADSVKYFEYTNLNKFPKKIKKFLSLQEINTIYCYKNLVPIFSEISIKAISTNNFIKELKQNLGVKEIQAILGLSHSVAANKISSTIGKEDYNAVNLIIMIDQLAADIKLYSSRLKEIYGWYFPELERMKSTEEYVICVNQLGKIREKEDTEIQKIGEDLDIPFEVIKESIGRDLSEFDWKAINNFSQMISQKIENRSKMMELLEEKMKSISPNLNELLGSLDSARFILMAGSLQNLAKMSSSTVQLLGAEKALFRSLKAKTVTPKYGKIYDTKIIIDTKLKYKARMARALASKISILARIDCFSQTKTNKYGEEIRNLCNEIKNCYELNKKPRTTDTVISSVYKQLTSSNKSE